jgi:hypothetical protein
VGSIRAGHESDRVRRFFFDTRSERRGHFAIAEECRARMLQNARFQQAFFPIGVCPASAPCVWRGARDQGGGNLRGQTRRRFTGQIARVELAPRGIRLNPISPSPIITPISTKPGLPAETQKGFEDQMAAGSLFKRFGTTEEVTKLARFLLSATPAPSSAPTCWSRSRAPHLSPSASPAMIAPALVLSALTIWSPSMASKSDAQNRSISSAKKRGGSRVFFLPIRNGS